MDIARSNSHEFGKRCKITVEMEIIHIHIFTLAEGDKGEGEEIYFLNTDTCRRNRYFDFNKEQFECQLCLESVTNDR